MSYTEALIALLTFPRSVFSKDQVTSQFSSHYQLTFDSMLLKTEFESLVSGMCMILI